MKTINFLILGLILAASPLAFAEGQASSTDLSVDNVMVKNAGWVGALPPTAGEAVAGPISNQANFVNATVPGNAALPNLVTKDRTDKKGQVYNLSGSVKKTQQGSTDWKEVKKGDVILEGDIILTGKDGAVSITFDKNYWNVSHIPANSRAVFKSIEPTDIFIEDGTIFNMFDGLPQGANWKVSSPTAVAAIRGTHMLVNYLASTGELIQATFDVPDDGHESFVKLIDVLENGKEGSSVDIPEGYQIDLDANQAPDASLLESIDQKWIDEIKKILEDLAKLRSGERKLPATSGEFAEPNFLDPAGPDTIGGGNDLNLETLDTNIIQGEPIIEEPLLEEEKYREPSEPPYEQPGCGNECS